jgi:two-component system NtrC family response regulator
MGIVSFIMSLLSKWLRKASAPGKKDKPAARVLVVDDDVTVCDVLEEFLRYKGYDVYAALDGPTGIAKVKEVRPHIVLLDIIMPGMGGIEVLKEIKRIDPSVGVIMVTGVGDDELGRRTLELGAYDYITKPVNFDYLEKALMVKIIDLLG